MTEHVAPAKLKPLDYASDQEVRWCPGCGDYAILRAVQRVLADNAVDTANTVFISGIGCSSRFPYYLSTYGFHTIHGRAPAFATGIKLANPELEVWLITGDGDGLSIGGNHLLHVLRRNLDVQIMLFNNEIYGLTKGQYSPTSRPGTHSPTSPLGSVERPVSPCSFALGAGGQFIARQVDIHKNLPAVLNRARGFRGAAFVEIFQNCLVYNDGVFDSFTQKKTAADHQLQLEHGEPMIFGAAQDKGLRVKPGSFELEVVALGENGITESDILVHDETNRALASQLVTLRMPEFPVILGVIYCEPAASYERAVLDQIDSARTAGGAPELQDLLQAGRTWTVT